MGRHRNFSKGEKRPNFAKSLNANGRSQIQNALPILPH